MSTLDEEDRREYYRIEDMIALEITPLSGPEALSKEVLLDDSPLFNLLSELHLSEFESQHLLRQIGERDRTLAAFLKVQNKRMDLLSQIMAQSLLGEIGTPQPVVISEGGIEFLNHTAIQPDSHLAVKLVLMPQALGLLLRAKVTHCDAKTGGFEIGTEFEAMTDAQRQLLARYILQKQAQERRLAREKSDESDT
ncbi:PilZ domain-containing protein [Pseudomonas sp. CBSPBW29]|uniref:PilZ domain-containing protein n=1 Tax=Pseudomonas TaxID=286 RepID=UPI0021ACB991|nr:MULTISPECIES: PilZ domain-containing protein [unclassified Pseudomonas]WEL44771.1 PilZ domain-containing protein [Pseudomonas sp. CBSPBW29]WEL65866.1 PilZ domain-containing protein [Pseudomonas sp. CBSPGW29]WEL69336.1 PilZ domain-containing protein [Pseudomonas sp. CBSPCGW29]WEL76323.1 PilZ domain-containing protein [Pseudomonas sp. CBSPAW29]WEL85093.1 PilZ domain-containing protein [Pseudomonas sp. CBSPCAW29]WEL87893.1 PilZ domain-containing protein [Pseudomonas sp. CBSPCBW29]